MVAVRRGHSECVRALIEIGGDLNATNEVHISDFALFTAGVG